MIYFLNPPIKRLNQRKAKAKAMGLPEAIKPKRVGTPARRKHKPSRAIGGTKIEKILGPGPWYKHRITFWSRSPEKGTEGVRSPFYIRYNKAMGIFFNERRKAMARRRRRKLPSLTMLRRRRRRFLSNPLENAWFGERARHRLAALKGWKRRRGLRTNLVENPLQNVWYGDPVGHRLASLKGWRRRRSLRRNPAAALALPTGAEITQYLIGGGIAGAGFMTQTWVSNNVFAKLLEGVEKDKIAKGEKAIVKPLLFAGLNTVTGIILGRVVASMTKKTEFGTYYTIGALLKVVQDLIKDFGPKKKEEEKKPEEKKEGQPGLGEEEPEEEPEYEYAFGDTGDYVESTQVGDYIEAEFV